MRKLLITFLLLFALFATSCQSLHRATKDKIGTTIAKKIMDGTIEIPELLVQQKMNWMITPLVVGLFTGIVLTFSGVRVIGLGVITASIACLILIITMSLYMKWVAAIGIVVLLVGVYFLGKTLYDNSIVKRDLVNSMETAKNLIPAEKKEILANTLDRIQSKFTQTIVKKLKKVDINK